MVIRHMVYALSTKHAKHNHHATTMMLFLFSNNIIFFVIPQQSVLYISGVSSHLFYILCKELRMYSWSVEYRWLWPCRNDLSEPLASLKSAQPESAQHFVIGRFANSPKSLLNQPLDIKIAATFYCWPVVMSSIPTRGQCGYNDIQRAWL